jgi:hypothetical protein
MQLRTVALNKAIPDSDVRLSTASVPIDPNVPFALIQYSIRGVDQPLNLRIDLQKRVFLDHLDDEVADCKLQSVAHEIVTLLHAVLHHARRGQRAAAR